jgi:hypothetical protein
MWEALSDNASNDLQRWARTELLRQPRAVDPGAEVNLYHNDTGRIVLIATGECRRIPATGTTRTPYSP